MNFMKQQNQFIKTHLKQIRQFNELRAYLNALLNAIDYRRQYNENNHQHNSRKRASMSKFSKKQNCFNYQFLII